MGVKSPGYGRKGQRGDQGVPGPAGAASTVPGPQGPQGAMGVQGPKGDTGAVGPQGSKGDTGASGPQGLKGDTGAAGATGPQGATGPAGSTFLGNVTVSETLLVSLALGTKRMTRPLAGVLSTDKLLAVPNGTPTTGCEVLNAMPAGAGQVSISYYTPALGVAASYSIPVSIYRLA